MTILIQTRPNQVKANHITNYKRIFASDLKIFVDRYKKERRWFQTNLELPPEIFVLDLIAKKYGTSVSHDNCISEDDFKTIKYMIETNQLNRGSYLKRRDSIIDRLTNYFEIGDSPKRYISFKEYFN